MNALTSILDRAALNATPASAEKKTNLDRADFLKLLTTQVRNQNPLDPLKEADFGNQLAQYSTLEEMTKLNASFTQMMYLQGLSQGAALIGKTVAFDAGGGQVSRGVVDAVRLEGGKVALQVGSRAVLLDAVRAVEK